MKAGHNFSAQLISDAELWLASVRRCAFAARHETTVSWVRCNFATLFIETNLEHACLLHLHLLALASCQHQETLARYIAGVCNAPNRSSNSS